MRPAIIFILLLSSCSSFEKTDSFVSCNANNLDVGVEIAKNRIEKPGSGVIEKFQFANDYGQTCGFYFLSETSPEFEGNLLAGPTEVILFKENWLYRILCIILMNCKRDAPNKSVKSPTAGTPKSFAFFRPLPRRYEP